MIALLRKSAFALLLLSAACQQPGGGPGSPQAEAFLDAYNQQYQTLSLAYAEAEWQANTYIVDGDEESLAAVTQNHEALAAFTGSEQNIQAARRLLEEDLEVNDLQRRQLERVLYLAAGNPQTVPDLVKRRIELEARLNQQLFAFDFQVDGESLDTNQIDQLLRESNNLADRRKVWEASKEVGQVLKADLAEARDLRNGVVQDLGYDNYYAYQVADYGMNADEMQALLDDALRQLRPLYRELHTWTRYELAKRYGSEVPELLPAHWLPNRWAQDWSALIQVEGVDLNGVLANKPAPWLLKQAEAFYVSMGFPSLPSRFWDQSSAYPLPADAGYKKNNHASAWHMDLDQDVRVLMSVVPNTDWYETTHHELGHIYYYLSYARPEVPLLLREGANRGFHEAIGSQMGLAAMQTPFLQARNLIAADQEIDPIPLLLKEALNNVVFMSFGAGTMPAFERALYEAEIPAEDFNEYWWQAATHYQGVVPPAPRGSEFADGLSKTHIINDPAQYYDYAFSIILLFQLHDHVARNILDQDPRASNYLGSKKAGEFLKTLLEAGATRDWRELLREATGSDFSAEPMLRYFEPLQLWLEKENQGRIHTLPPL
ncbi:MAG: peptidase [Planctomycetota bacterium]|nr:MAG: peptidase [Planctomycetota bacterium]